MQVAVSQREGTANGDTWAEHVPCATSAADGEGPAADGGRTPGTLVPCVGRQSGDCRARGGPG